MPIGDVAVYVRAADRPALISLLSPPAQPYPQLWEVSPNAESCIEILRFMSFAEGQADTLSEVTGHHVGEDPAQQLRQLARLRGTRSPLWSGDHGSVLKATYDVLIALQEFNAGALIQAADALEQCSSALIQRDASSANSLTPRLAAFLAGFAVEVIGPIEEGVLYVHCSNEPKFRSWWRTGTALELACKTAMQHMDADVSKPTPAALVPFRTWLDTYATHLAKLHLGAATQQAVPIEHASAWYLACALRNRLAGRVAYSILFLHRAVDWALMAKMANLGYIDFATYGGMIKSSIAPNLTDHRPGFTNNLSVLIDNTTMPAHLQDALWDLNGWRNVSPYAHHLSVPDRLIADGLIDLVIRSFPRYMSSATWDAACTAFYQPIPLDAAAILDPDGALRTGATLI